MSIYTCEQLQTKIAEIEIALSDAIKAKEFRVEGSSGKRMVEAQSVSELKKLLDYYTTKAERICNGGTGGAKVRVCYPLG